MFNPLTPGHFAKKCLSKRVKPFLGRCLAEKNPNCPKRCLQVEHRTSFCSRCQITAFKVRACAESKISLLLSLLPASFAFLSPFFFFCGAFTRVPFGGKRFCKISRIRNFFLKEVPVGSGTRFSLEFSAQSYTVFCIFLWSVRLNRAHLGMA